MLALLIVAVLGTALLAFSLLFDDLLGDFLDLPFLSGTAIGGFCTAFGWAGLIGASTTDHLGIGIGIGLGCGLLVGGAAGALTKALTNAEPAEAPSMATIVGRGGVVISAIPEGHFGTVSVTVGSHVTRYSARSDTPLPAGTPIEVTAALSSTAVLVRAVRAA